MNNRVVAQEQISEKINEVRGRTLDAIEAQIGNSPTWQTVRRQMLKLFGDLTRTVEESFCESKGSEHE